MSLLCWWQELLENQAAAHFKHCLVLFLKSCVLFFFPFSNFQSCYTEATSVQHLAVFLGAYHGNCSDRALFLLDVQTSQAGLSSRACSHPGEPLLQDLGFFKGQTIPEGDLSHGWSLLPSWFRGPNACSPLKQRIKLYLNSLINYSLMNISATTSCFYASLCLGRRKTEHRGQRHSEGVLRAEL